MKSAMGVRKSKSAKTSNYKIENAAKIKKKKDNLKMMKLSKPKRDPMGKIIRTAEFQSSSKSGEMSRIEPNRKWFGNTRVITQNELQKFVNETKAAKNDPFKVILKPGNLPMSLLLESKKKKVFDLLQHEPFEDTFGEKSTRIRPKIAENTLQDLANRVEKSVETYSNEISTSDKMQPREMCFKYGQSKRIWNELHKVIDSSDVIFEVIDARDPMGTRSFQIEKFIRENKPHKHIIIILNKCDLIPNQVIKSWIYQLSKDFPTVAFRASIQRAFGKSSVFNLLRQIAKLHIDKKNISVGFVGYPNVGKSSIINTLVGRKVCNVAPIPGETKVWQYISLMKRVFLVDCPGVVYPNTDSESEIIMKGVVRVEYIKNPAQYMPALLDRIRPEYLTRTYGVMSWITPDDFLEQLAFKSGRLLKGAIPDVDTVAKMIINDFQRGKLPYFVKPPNYVESVTPDVVESQIEVEQQPLDAIIKTTEFSENHLNQL